MNFDFFLQRYVCPWGLVQGGLCLPRAGTSIVGGLVQGGLRLLRKYMFIGKVSGVLRRDFFRWGLVQSGFISLDAGLSHLWRLVQGRYTVPQLQSD